ncbi:MAG: sulfotransferase family protein [Steroidobacteraceae bacterium]
MRDAAADRERLLAIQRAAQGGELPQAAELAEAALAEGLEHPLIFNVLALRHELAGALGEAERLLRQAVSLAGTDKTARNALGLCLLRLERPAEALEQFDALLALDPALPFAHASRGTALFALARVREAEAAFLRAIERDPQQAVALAGLARIASYRGLHRQAREWAQRALARLPGYPDAELSLAAADLGEQDPLTAEARLRELLARADLAAEQRAFAGGLLGDALDAQGRMPEAFAAYTESNALQRATYAAQFGDASQNARQYAQGLADYLRAAAAARWRAPPPVPGPAPAAGHIFVLGFLRSGTSLLEVILEGHPQVVSVEESESLIDGLQRFMQQPQDLDSFLHAPPSIYEALRAAYWRRVAQTGANVAGKVFVDKNPLNTLKLPLIARLFPQAKILVACRDPRDIVLSCFRHRFRMSAPVYEMLTLEGAARYYDAVMRVLMECTRLLPLQMCLVRHEDVVTGFAREMRRVCDFLGLEWDPAMGDFALRTREREALTPSTAQLARGLNTEGLGHWRRYREQLGPALPLLAPWVAQFYYDEAGGSGRLNQQLNATVIRSPSPSKGVT